MPKTAGVSISHILKNYGIDNIGTQHSPLREYRELIDKKDYDSLYKFCVVRNPWDLLISYYFSPHWAESKDPYFKEHPHDKLNSPDELIYYLKTDLQPLRYYISTDNKKGLIEEINYVIRFDNLEEDFKNVERTLGINENLPVKNKSEHVHYREYYDEKLKNMVYEKFKEEIKFFNFEF